MSMVMDNYATHKTKPIRDWLAKRPRWHVHFTPTGASWINQVERFFALLTEKQIRRGVHRSTQQLENDIRTFIDTHNADPKPFRWTRSADDILAAIQRFCQRTLQIGGTKESGHYHKQELWNDIGRRSGVASCRECEGRPALPAEDCIVPM